MKKISVIAAFVLLVASATWVMAGPFGKAGWDRDEWCPAASQLSTLNLSTEQSEKVRGLRESFLKETTPIRNQLFTKRAELRLLWIQTSLNVDKIRSIQKEIHDLIGQMQEKTTDFRLAFRNVLTPEQTTQLLAQGVGRGPGANWGRGPGGQGAGPAGCPGSGQHSRPGWGPGSCR
jgi:Spy/CpxP family protein refolding chaperone